MNNMQKEIPQEEHPILFLVGLVCLLSGISWFALKTANFLLEKLYYLIQNTEFTPPTISLDHIMAFVGFIGVIILVCLAVQDQHKE